MYTVYDIFSALNHNIICLFSKVSIWNDIYQSGWEVISTANSMGVKPRWICMVKTFWRLVEIIENGWSEC